MKKSNFIKGKQTFNIRIPIANLPGTASWNLERTRISAIALLLDVNVEDNP